MKRIASFLLVITLITTFATSGYAQNPAAKLGRGLINTLTGLWELPVDVLKTSKSDGWPMGISVGLGRGLAMGIYRTVIGVYEVVTFPIPIPAGYEAITDPATLITSETLEAENPGLRGDFRPLSSELEKTTTRRK